MFAEYVAAALERAVYKTLEGEEEPIFVSVPDLPGAWATGKEGAYRGYRRIGAFGHPVGHPNPSDWRPYSKCSPGDSGCRIGSLQFFTPDLIKRLKELGFVGPYTGSDHAFMVRGTNRVKVPNPHKKEIDVNLLLEILREGRISRDEWSSTD